MAAFSEIYFQGMSHTHLECLHSVYVVALYSFSDFSSFSVFSFRGGVHEWRW